MTCTRSLSYVNTPLDRVWQHKHLCTSTVFLVQFKGKKKTILAAPSIWPILVFTCLAQSARGCGREEKKGGEGGSRRPFPLFWLPSDVRDLGRFLFSGSCGSFSGNTLMAIAEGAFLRAHCAAMLASAANEISSLGGKTFSGLIRLEVVEQHKSKLNILPGFTPSIPVGTSSLSSKWLLLISSKSLTCLSPSSLNISSCPIVSSLPNLSKTSLHTARVSSPLFTTSPTEFYTSFTPKPLF